MNKRAIPLSVACVLAVGLHFTLLTPIAHAGAPQQEKAVAPTPTRESITDQEIELLRQDLRAQRRQIVAASLPLTTDEATKFWPVYDQYIAETIKINDSRFALIKDYASNYSSMTDAQASSYVHKLSDVDKAMIDLRLKYMPTVQNVLPPMKAALFLQIERRIQLMIDLQLAGQMPLITPKK